ncbi:MAG: hypothetical protein H0X62_11975, partial [Bacteroidetes bacterium]|nr:hypothetical protein [Bacteroidota bacterium]
QLADLVKFAKVNQVADENEQSITHAVEFINATVPGEIVKTPVMAKEGEHV